MRTIAVVALIFVAALSRLLPHPPNVSPLIALGLFGAAHLLDRRLAFVLPLAAMALSDIGLELLAWSGVYSGWMAQTRGFHSGMVVVYATLAIITAMGLLLRRKRSVARIAAVTFASSLIFFLITNGAVWLFEGLYPRTPAGLWTCYVAGLPFFRNTVLGDAAYSVLLFGGFALAAALVPGLREPRLSVAHDLEPGVSA
jgi:uncharacterized membrane protein (GlpM family)